jgi:hypothetical protein
MSLGNEIKYMYTVCFSSASNLDFIEPFSESIRDGSSLFTSITPSHPSTLLMVLISLAEDDKIIPYGPMKVARRLPVWHFVGVVTYALFFPQIFDQ